MNQAQHIVHGTIKPYTENVSAMCFGGDLASIIALEIFTKTKTHDTYATNLGAGGVMYNTTHLNLPVPGDTKMTRDVVLFPGTYLVRTSDGGYYTMSPAAFHETYDTPDTKRREEADDDV